MTIKKYIKGCKKSLKTYEEMLVKDPDNQYIKVIIDSLVFTINKYEEELNNEFCKKGIK